MGIVSASLIDRLGTDGTIINFYSGPLDQPSQAVLALNLPKEQLDRLISVNIQTFFLNDNDDQDNSNLSSEPENANNLSRENNEILGKRKSEGETRVGGKMRKKNEDTEKALKILNEKKGDALIIVGKEHPTNIFMKLIKFLEISRPFVVYSPLREPLQDLYCDLKQRNDIISLRLTESWLRDYQILPERTHPDIRISGSGGYLLSGFYVNS